MISIFCFYNISSGVQAKLSFSKEFKHCNIITFDGDLWLASELDLTGVHIRKVNVSAGSHLMRGLKCIKSLIAIVAVSVNEPAKHPWRPFLVRSCNELDRYISGVDTGFTLNPQHLYKKLLKYDSTGNFEILYHWRR